MGSRNRARVIRKVQIRGTSYDFGSWRLHLLVEKGVKAPPWNVTCAKKIGTAVDRHRHERQARAVLRDFKKRLGVLSGLQLVLAWVRVATQGEEKMQLRALRDFLWKYKEKEGKAC